MLRLDESQYNDIHRIMGYVLESDDGVILDRMHIGQHQDFYRRLLSLGVSVLKQEWDKKVKEYEGKDDSKG